MDDKLGWKPEAISADEFHGDEAWANVNRVPYDRISNVIFKRAMTIKSVRYEPGRPAPEMPEPWQGRGTTVIRWLFSEGEGTEEGLLQDARFGFLQDVTLEAGAATGQRAVTEYALVLTIISGRGMLYHRPTDGSPVVARPLHIGDAVLVYHDELFSLANDADTPLQIMMLGLRKGTEE
jgi:hypothetical protein